MIIDCFPFFNELDLLEIRLNELDSVVDKFVLVEAELTQSLLAKPLYFNQNKERFSQFLPKIEHVIIRREDCIDNNGNLWKMENFQRDQIAVGLQNIKPHENDIIMISDLDEIPHKLSVSLVAHLLSINNNLPAVSLEMEFLAYFINLKASNRKWIGTVMTKYANVVNSSPQYIRNIKDHFSFKPDSGWHFSWLGGYEKIYEKSLSCIEPFDKTQLPSKEDFKKHFEQFKQGEHKFFIHLENLSKKETAFEKISLESKYPQYLKDNIYNFKHFIL